MQRSTEQSSSRPTRTFLIPAAYFLLGVLSVLMLCDFVLRGVVPAFEPAKTDFSEVYTSAWLWRHGQNFYESSLATETQLQLVGVSVRIAPIYPPTAFVLLSPITFLPWGWANFAWLLVCLAGIAATIFLLSRLCGFKAWDLSMMALATYLLSFSPLHLAFHLGNVALVVVPLVLCAILLAERELDWQAGLVLGIALCLKPQIAVWVLLYYLLRRRMKMTFSAVAAGTFVVAILLLRPTQLFGAIQDYRANLHYWLDPGRPFGFTPGALPFHVNILQVILYRLLHSVLAANVIAHSLFVCGFAFWILTLWRAKFRIPAPLAISSLLALSFLSLYHGVTDATILTLALCWAFPSQPQSWTPIKVVTCALFLVMMLPGHSLLMRLSPHLAPSITTSWWWNLFVARYFVWLLLALNITLLCGLWQSARSVTESTNNNRDERFSTPGTGATISLE
jgi:hypothetical protein